MPWEVVNSYYKYYDNRFVPMTTDQEDALDLVIDIRMFACFWNTPQYSDVNPLSSIRYIFFSITTKLVKAFGDLVHSQSMTELHLLYLSITSNATMEIMSVWQYKLVLKVGT